MKTYLLQSPLDSRYVVFTANDDEKTIIIKDSHDCETKQDFLILWRENCLAAFMNQVAINQTTGGCVEPWAHEALERGKFDDAYYEIGFHQCKRFDDYTILKQL